MEQHNSQPDSDHLGSTFSPMNGIDSHANARLIAAAPVMLAALKRIAQEDAGGYLAAIAIPAIRATEGA